MKTGEQVLVRGVVEGYLGFRERPLVNVGDHAEIVRGLLYAPGAVTVPADSMLPLERVPHVSLGKLLNWAPMENGMYSNRFVSAPGADAAIIAALVPFLEATELVGLGTTEQEVIDFVVLAVNERLERMRAAVEPVR